MLAEMLGMENVAGIRLGSGLKHVSGIRNASNCIVCAWLPGTDKCWEMELRADWGIDFSKMLGKQWKECAFIQLYCFPPNLPLPGKIDLNGSSSAAQPASGSAVPAPAAQQLPPDVDVRPLSESRVQQLRIRTHQH